MASIPYIIYKELKEFYTISEICKLFEMEKPELRRKCEKYDIQPRRNEIGEHGFIKYDVRKLHNAIYHETAGQRAWEDDPWRDRSANGGRGRCAAEDQPSTDPENDPGRPDPGG